MPVCICEWAANLVGLTSKELLINPFHGTERSLACWFSDFGPWVLIQGWRQNDSFYISGVVCKKNICIHTSDYSLDKGSMPRTINKGVL